MDGRFTAQTLNSASAVNISIAAGRYAPDAGPLLGVEPEMSRRWFKDLIDAVAGAFVETGAQTPGWADPNRGREPLPEQYGRCDHPKRYAIVHARAAAWSQALARLGLVDVHPTAPQTWLGSRRKVDMIAAVSELRPRKPGGASLMLALVDTIDGWVLTTARGGVLHAASGSHTITREVSGWRGSGNCRADWLDPRYDGPDHVLRWIANPWL